MQHRIDQHAFGGDIVSGLAVAPVNVRQSVSREAGAMLTINGGGIQPDTLLAEDKEIASFPIELQESDIEVLDIMQVFEG